MSKKIESSEKQRMIQLLDSLATKEGFTESGLKDVKFLRATRPIPRRPRTHEPCIVIVGQGRKCGYLGDEVYAYDSCNYFVLSVPLPFECETIASPEEPLLAVSIGVDLALLGELLVQMDDDHLSNGSVPRGIYATPLTDELVSATVLLLESLSQPLDSRILGPQIVREIIYGFCSENRGKRCVHLQFVIATSDRSQRYLRSCTMNTIRNLTLNHWPVRPT